MGSLNDGAYSIARRAKLEGVSLDQDSTEQGKRVIKNGAAEVWVKHLSDGSIAVLMLNRDY